MPKTFVRFDCHGAHAPAYSCSAPGDQSGNYVPFQVVRDLVANLVADGNLTDDGAGKHYFTCEPEIIDALCYLAGLGDLHAAQVFVESGGFDHSDIDEANDWYRLNVRYCPDGGACHHDCSPVGSCSRARTCLPLSCAVKEENNGH